MTVIDLFPLGTDTTWMNDAACQGSDPELFFPPNIGPETYRQAREICMTCPVRLQCRDTAADRREKHGMWGGLDPGELRNFIRRRRRNLHPHTRTKERHGNL